LTAAERQTVLDWLVLMGWNVEVKDGGGRLGGAASRHLHGKVVRVVAEGDTMDALAWSLVQAATTALERLGERPKAVRAAA
jgi:hypothetical protein